EGVQFSGPIAVVRDEKTGDRLTPAGTPPAAIARAMVGRDVALAGSTAFGIGTVTTASSAPSREAVYPLEVAKLVVRDARRQIAVDGVSFAVAAGEILGIAGVEGNGQTELIEAIA